MARFLILIAVLFGLGFLVLRLLSGGGGDEQLEAVAAALTESGYELQVGETEVDDTRSRLTDVTLVGPTGPLAWRLSAPTVIVDRGDGGRIGLDFASPVTVGYTVGTEARTATVSGDRIRVDLVAGDDGAIRQLTFAGTALSIVRHGGGDPMLVKSARVVVTRPSAGGIIPAETTALVDIDDVTLPEQRDGPFGPLVDLVKGTVTFDRAVPTLALGTELPAWQSGGGALSISDGELAWGTLSLKTEGDLSLDAQYRPSGEFSVEIADLMTVLDAVHAVRGSGDEGRAGAFATLLRETAIPPTPPPRYLVRLADGAVVLVRVDGALPDTRLGSVAPVAILP